MRKAVMAKLEQMMDEDKNIIILLGDLGFYFFDDIRKKFPDRCINVGTCEQAMVGFAAGLAKEGKKVVVYSIIPFLIYRPFEQLFLDVGYHNLPVIFIGSSEGYSYSFEAISHFALNDLTLTLQIPTFSVYTPAEPEEAVEFLEEAFNNKTPTYLRLSKMNEKRFVNKIFTEKGMTLLSEGRDGLVISIGGISHEVETAISSLRKENIKITHIHIGKIKPLDLEVIKKYAKNFKEAITVEEHNVALGFGRFLSSYIEQKTVSLGVEDIFNKVVGDRDYMLSKNKIDSESIKLKIKEIRNKKF